jgi:hypothetical protein
MESSNENGRFPKTSKYHVSILLRIKGTLAGKDITISIAPAERNNCIGDEFVNQ